ncbi:MAG TPA: SurA N-terminal domain-containing protein [Polyangia bacterium]|jgi:peptidyl-prolyl cis-trans isomerase D|nr:SurA N-terminal domain-containing protein [Polyangia bacterium]
MLQAMRRNSRHAIIYVLFGILIAAFVISFGPGSRGFGYQGVSSAYAAKVAGSTVSEQDFHFAYVALGRTRYPPQMAREQRLKEQLMDRIIERELFAEEAERLGYNVSMKEVEDMIADGRMMVVGIPERIDSYVYKDGKFDYDRFKMVSQNQLGVTVRHFIEIEQRELMADKVRELIRVGAKVSPDDVKKQFAERGLQVNLEYARFPERKYEEEIGEPTPAEIDAYVKAHADTLKKSYDDRAFLYKNLEKQAQLRHIVIDVKKDAPAAEVDAAKKQIDAAAAKIKGGAEFAAVAKDTSSDERTKARGGEIGWRKKTFTGFGDAVDGKIFAAQTKKGDIIGPERTDRGFELVQVEGFREGDVPLIEAEKEIAAEEVRKDKAKAKAKADAQALMDRVHKGEKLDAIVPKEAPDAPGTSAQEKQLKALLQKPSEPVKLQETGLFSRRGDIIQDIGISKDLAKQAFDLKTGEVAGPFDVGTGFVVVQVKEHKDPDLADFEKRKSDIVRDAERSKWAELVDTWSKQRCIEVRDDGRITVNSEALEYEGVGKGVSKYEPCAMKPMF